MGLPTGPDTLIRRQRQQYFSVPVPEALGVDDFSFRRGVTFGTVLVDLNGHEPIGILAGHTTKPLAGWLSEHEEVKVLTQDRSEAYASAASSVAPHSIRMADRLHLVRNVSDELKDLVRSQQW